VATAEAVAGTYVCGNAITQSLIQASDGKTFVHSAHRWPSLRKQVQAWQAARAFKLS
jgi:hypothetical protein